jgi:two-component system chemotaxis response regulator CheY
MALGVIAEVNYNVPRWLIKHTRTIVPFLTRRSASYSELVGTIATEDELLQMSTSSHTTARVLIAEDSPVCRKLLEVVLAGQPYELRFVTDGVEALDQLVEFQPDILISDWLMPGLSGLELCRHIRTSGNPYTYIVFVTQNANTEHLVEGLDAGADDYLAKPFATGELLARIRVGCRTVQMRRKIEAQNALLEKTARTDHLTGLPNRLAVEEFASKQLQAAMRHKYGFWVVVTDLDKFKLVNDTYGHFAGDEAIKRFATVLKANTRASDICGRLGGDEFLLIMTHGEKKSMIQTVERLRADFANESCVLNGHEVLVTASFGIAGFDGTGEPTLQELLTRADHALYSAKAFGRNQVRAEVPSHAVHVMSPIVRP